MPANNEGAFERFRRTNTVKDNCTTKKTSYFIEHHLSSTNILVERTNENLPAVLVVNDTEGADQFLTFVYQDADIQLGDYFTWKEDNHFFILESVHIIKEVDYKKFRALECNAVTSDGKWIYFKGNMKTYRDIALKGNYEINSLNPVVIAPISAGFVINGDFVMNNQTWHIVDADLDTIKGIGYYYVERDLNPRNMEADIEALEDADALDPANTLYVGEKVTLSTYKGYIEADKAITILSRSANSVEFAANEAGDMRVIVRNSGGANVTYIYSVKEL